MSQKFILFYFNFYVNILPCYSNKYSISISFLEENFLVLFLPLQCIDESCNFLFKLIYYCGIFMTQINNFIMLILIWSNEKMRKFSSFFRKFIYPPKITKVSWIIKISISKAILDTCSHPPLVTYLIYVVVS